MFTSRAHVWKIYGMVSFDSLTILEWNLEKQERKYFLNKNITLNQNHLGVTFKLRCHTVRSQKPPLQCQHDILRGKNSLGKSIASGLSC